MGFLSNLFGSSIKEPVEAVGNVLDKLFTSDEEKIHSQIVLEKLKQHPQELQIELNKMEAQHSSLWVAGWRPFIGWVCGFSLGCYYIPQAIISAYIWARICLDTMQLQPLPTIAGLMDLILALLGLGMMRTAEKFGGKTK
jgi:hypothetical protein